MKLCICQLIKDEHDYIEEWIEYHHNLGINDFYLIEDVKSKSHKNLLKKYDYVHLYKLQDIMNEYESELLNDYYLFRQRIAYIIFERLWRNSYDWMFFIDPDEYVDCDKEHLFNVLNNNINNPIISMQWKMMKCDGHLYHPNNHKKYSLINTYKTYTYDYTNYKQIINCKHELSKYTHFKFLPHYFEFNNNLCDIDLKHFAYKSFEEHINHRLINKGIMHNRYITKIDHFFKINNEYNKEEVCKLFNIDESNFKITVNENLNLKQYNINSMSFTNVQCNILNNFINKYKPKNICEFGCGVTTDVFLDYKKQNNVNLLSIEHNVNFKKHDNTKIFKLYENANIIIDDNHKYLNINKYYGLEEYFKTLKNIKFDFICIDGPFGWNSSYYYTRIQLLDFILYDLIDDNCIFMVHDAERISTIRTLEIFELELIKHNYKFISYDDFRINKSLKIYKIFKQNYDTIK